MAIASVPCGGRPACTRCGFRIGFGYEVSADATFPDGLAFSRFLQERDVEVLQAAGAQQVWKGPAVDRHHRTHDIPNLFVCDRSSFVTSGRGQPTMITQALALCAGKRIARFAQRSKILFNSVTRARPCP